jgi:hypothetical protein
VRRHGRSEHGCGEVIVKRVI